MSDFLLLFMFQLVIPELPVIRVEFTTIAHSK